MNEGQATITDSSSHAEERTPFVQAFLRYRGALSALRRFAKDLRPVIEDMEHSSESAIAEQANVILRELNDDEMRQFTEEMNSFNVPQEGGAVQVKFSGRGAMVALKLLQITYENMRRDRLVLNSGILSNLTSQFEVLISELVHAYYDKHPGLLMGDEKVLSLQELRDFSSVDEAFKAVVSKRVDELLRQSLEEWRKFFSRIGIDISRLVPSWSQVDEIYQRRHAFVHGGGVATKQYVSRVNFEEVNIPENRVIGGSHLTVPDDYIDSAIDIFEILGTLLCQEVWRKVDPGSRLRANRWPIGGLQEAIYRRVLDHNWFVVEQLAKWGESDSTSAEADRWTCRINRWLAVKRQERWDEVREDVTRVDRSALGARFSLAVASLLDEPEAFFRLLPAAEADGVDYEALKDWPVLDEMRTDERYTQALERTKPTGGTSAEIARGEGAPPTDIGCG